MLLRIIHWWYRHLRRVRLTPGAPEGVPTSVLLVELTRLGDALSALPAVNVIRSAYPSADVHWLVRESIAAFLRPYAPGVEIHDIPEGSAVRLTFAAIRVARKMKWSLCCSLGPGRVNGLVTIFSGADAFAGYLECSGSKTPFRKRNRVSSFGTRGESEVLYDHEPLAFRSLKVCAALGIPVPQQLPTAHIRSAEASDRLSRNIALVSSRTYVVFHPFAAWKFRMWDLTRWVELARLIADPPRRSVIIIGQASDPGTTEFLRGSWKNSPGITLLENSSILETARMIAHAGLFIGCDSGPLHLATLLGVPSIGLYGPAAPELTRPVWSHSIEFRGLYHPVECSPCDQRRCVRPGATCMGLISAREVAEAARAILDSVHEGTVPHS